MRSGFCRMRRTRTAQSTHASPHSRPPAPAPALATRVPQGYRWACARTPGYPCCTRAPSDPACGPSGAPMHWCSGESHTHAAVPGVMGRTRLFRPERRTVCGFVCLFSQLLLHRAGERRVHADVQAVPGGSPPPAKFAQGTCPPHDAPSACSVGVLRRHAPSACSVGVLRPGPPCDAGRAQGERACQGRRRVENQERRLRAAARCARLQVSGPPARQMAAHRPPCAARAHRMGPNATIRTV